MANHKVRPVSPAQSSTQVGRCVSAKPLLVCQHHFPEIGTVALRAAQVHLVTLAVHSGAANHGSR
jgi:hypothetical protein